MAKFLYMLPLARNTKTRSMVAEWGGPKPPKKHRKTAVNIYDAHRGSRWYWEEPCQPYLNPAISVLIRKLVAQKVSYRETYTATHVIIESKGGTNG